MPGWSTSTIPTPLSTEAVTNGKICLDTPTTTHLILDLNGYYTAANSWDTETADAAPR